MSAASAFWWPWSNDSVAETEAKPEPGLVTNVIKRGLTPVELLRQQIQRQREATAVEASVTNESNEEETQVAEPTDIQETKQKKLDVETLSVSQQASKSQTKTRTKSRKAQSATKVRHNQKIVAAKRRRNTSNRALADAKFLVNSVAGLHE
ncbi:MAG: hypothetical protein MHM6MM_003171 [Cercozoa sp. M6MM]